LPSPTELSLCESDRARFFANTRRNCSRLSECTTNSRLFLAATVVADPEEGFAAEATRLCACACGVVAAAALAVVSAAEAVVRG
jgi:hypothetical protein